MRTPSQTGQAKPYLLIRINPDRSLSVDRPGDQPRQFPTLPRTIGELAQLLEGLPKC